MQVGAASMTEYIKLYRPERSWLHAFAAFRLCSRGAFLRLNTSYGNLERRFRRLREIRCPERAQLRDVSVENCMRVEQAPPTKILHTLQSSFSDARASRHQADKKQLQQACLEAAREASWQGADEDSACGAA